MKAIRLHAPGGPGQVVYEDAPLPVLQKGDALVRVFASGTTRNELDWGPTYTDEKGNSRLPSIPGHELCGVVEKITDGVTEIKPGDIVYGLTSFFRDGTAAEYIAVDASGLAPKPAAINAVQAASLPLSALTAWQALFQHGRLAKGQRVLIHGAAGGVGTLAVQMARWCGAYIIATASTESSALVKELGADEVIDYSQKRFDKETNDIDLVLDCIGGDTQDRSWKVLKRGGVLVSIAGESIRQPSPELGVKGIFFIVTANRNQLIEIGQLVDSSVIRPVIAYVFPLSEARKAFEEALLPGRQGKIVLEIDSMENPQGK